MNVHFAAGPNYGACILFVYLKKNAAASVAVGGKSTAVLKSVGGTNVAALVVSVQGGLTWHPYQWDEGGEGRLGPL